MTSSPELNELAAALSKAQAVMTGALKDAANPFYKSKYADLESVWHACRKPLTDNGLSVVQYGSVMAVDGCSFVPTIVTRLLHSSGQWMEGVTLVRAKDDTAQGMGSAITYARRYGLAAMVGVYQTDDDGEAAQGRPAATLTAAGQSEYLAGFRDALVKKNYAKVLAVHEDLNGEGQEAYSQVWKHLGSGERAAIKDAISLARDEKR